MNAETGGSKRMVAGVPRSGRQWAVVHVVLLRVGRELQTTEGPASNYQRTITLYALTVS